MAPREPVPKSKLYDALETYGRDARELSVKRLYADKVGGKVLAAVGTDEQLADPNKRHHLAVQIDAQLRSIIASIKDSVDRRIAQAVFATEEEFFGKLVTQRLAYVRENDCGFSDEQFKDRRARVIGEVEVELADALKGEAIPPLCGEPKSHDDVHKVPTTGVEHSMVDPPRGQAAHLGGAAHKSDTQKRKGRGRLILTGAAAAAVVLVVVAVAVVLTRDNGAHAARNGMSAAQLEQRYDGKLPQGQDGQESHCADPPRSEPVAGDSTPPVMGPDGTEVARVHLRKSPICPTVVWARVVWYDDEQRRFTIPPGWTLHVVMTRPDTQSRIDETEPKNGSTIHYAYSRMLTSAGGCVYAQVYFTKGDSQPPIEVVTTSCVQV